MSAASSRESPAPRLRVGGAGSGVPSPSCSPRFARIRASRWSPRRPTAGSPRALRARLRATAHASVASLCADESCRPSTSPRRTSTTPSTHPSAHARQARAVEKPMAFSLEEAGAMIDAARAAARQLIVGHSHSFDAPVRRARDIVASGAVGRCAHDHGAHFTDSSTGHAVRGARHRRRRRRAVQPGGHQVDVVRLLAGGLASRVRTHTGAGIRRGPPRGRTRRSSLRTAR